MDCFAISSVVLIVLTLADTASLRSRTNDTSNWMDSTISGRLKTSLSPFTPSIIDTREITYTEKISEYPEEKLRDLITKEGQKHKDFFGNETILAQRFPSKFIARPVKPGRFLPREHSDVQLCPSLIQIIFPKVAVNKDGEWKFVINVGSNYTQGVRIETCRHSYSCTFNSALPPRYTSSCEQRFVYKRLLAITEEGNIAVDEFKMPSCCMCVIKKVQVF